MHEIVEDVYKLSENLPIALNRALNARETDDPVRKVLENVYWNLDEDEYHVWCDATTDEGAEMAIALFNRFYGYVTSQGHYVEHEKS